MNQKYRIWGVLLILSQFTVSGLLFSTTGSQAALYWKLVLCCSILSGIVVGVSAIAAPHLFKETKFIHAVLVAGILVAAQAGVLAVKFF